MYSLVYLHKKAIICLLPFLFLLPVLLAAQSAAHPFTCQGFRSSESALRPEGIRSVASKSVTGKANPNLKSTFATEQLPLLEYKRKSLLSITTSAYDIGSPEKMFDQDTLTLMRTAHINPAIIQLEFTHIQTIDQVRVFLGQSGYGAIDKDSWFLESANTIEDLELKTGSYSLIVPLRSDIAGTYDKVRLSTAIHARLFRFTITRTVGDGYVHIPELELWGHTDSALSQRLEYVSFHNLVVIYKNTNHGSLPQTIEEDVRIPLHTASEFIFRNSYFSFLPTWTVYVVEDYAPLFSGDDGWIAPGVVDQDLRNRGLPLNEYDCVYIIANGSNNGAWGTVNMLEKGGYFQTGWWGSEYGKFVTVHEFDHIIDAMFAALGYADFPYNHPDAAFSQGEFVGHGGDNWDVDGELIRFWGRERWLNLHKDNRWGKMLVTQDQDSDGVPDRDSRLPIDEWRLHSSVTSKDSDQDALSDLKEAMAGKFTASDPLHTDTDKDGFADSVDLFPLYPVSTEITFKKVDYTSDLKQWPLNGNYYYAHPEDKSKTELRLAFDESFLYVGIKVGSATTGELHLFLDCNNDGLFYGKDNLHIIFDNNVIKQLILRDATNNITETSLPVDAYHGVSVVGADWKTYQLAIPRQTEYGLDLTDNEAIGLWVRVFDYGNLVGADMFEPNDLFECRLKYNNRIVVNAKGTKAGKQNAHFNLFVNHTLVGDAYATTTYQPYTFHIPFPESQIQSVDIEFDNDAVYKKQDRNLYIKSIEVGNQPILATRNNVRYVSKRGKQLPYTGMMWINGDLIFDLTENLVITARGSMAKNEYAHFKVFINNNYIGETFTSPDYKPYSFPLPYVISEKDEIRIRFDNDIYIPNSIDRNLYVKNIRVGNAQMVLTAENTRYIRDNHLDVRYSGTMPFNGDLIIHPLLINSSSAREASVMNAESDSRSDIQFMVYPNPNRGQFKLDIQGAAGKTADIDVFDFTAKKVYTASSSLINEWEVLPVTLQSVKAGIYFVSFKINQHTVIRKVLIQY